MRKNKLITLVAAVSLFAGTGVSVITNNQITYAAKKTKKSAAKVARVQIKRGAVAYTYTVKDNKITSVKPYKYKNKKMYLKALKANAIWSTKYKKTTYYFVKVGKTNLLVRAKDTKRLNKIAIPSFSTYMDNYKKKIQAEVDAIPKPTVQGKTNRNATYYEHKDGQPDNQVTQADTQLAKGTELTVLYQIDQDGTTFYLAQLNDKLILIQKNFVDLDQADANVLPESQYKSAIDTYNSNVKKVLAKYGVSVTANN